MVFIFTLVKICYKLPFVGYKLKETWTPVVLLDIELSSHLTSSTYMVRPNNNTPVYWEDAVLETTGKVTVMKSSLKLVFIKLLIQDNHRGCIICF